MSSPSLLAEPGDQVLDPALGLVDQLVARRLVVGAALALLDLVDEASLDRLEKLAQLGLADGAVGAGGSPADELLEADRVLVGLLLPVGLGQAIHVGAHLIVPGASPAIPLPDAAAGRPATPRTGQRARSARVSGRGPRRGAPPGASRDGPWCARSAGGRRCPERRRRPRA